MSVFGGFFQEDFSFWKRTDSFKELDLTYSFLLFCYNSLILLKAKVKGAQA
jgi:hypothetical protein